jgi:hypothetical protein
VTGEWRHHTLLEPFEGFNPTPQAALGALGANAHNPIAPPNPAFKRLGLWPALVLALLAFLGVSGLETFSIDPDRPAAILFSDQVSADQAFAQLVATGGLPIRPARSALSDGVVWIAAAGSPDFFERVKATGAWVINPFAFGGCFLVKPA